MISLTINGKAYSLDVEAETPLLWVIRDELGMTGTKFGCGIAQCGACTVRIDGEAMRSCSVQVGDMANKTITTIEGLSPDARHPGAAGLARRGRAAMRLLSVRADHGRGRFSSSTRSRPTPISTPTSTISAAAEPTSASPRYSSRADQKT